MIVRHSVRCQKRLTVTLAPDYHIEIGGHYYSVPSKLIREIVDVRITGATVARR